MIKIEKTDTYGWEAAIRGMRNPKNSWDKSDSTFVEVFDDAENLNTYYMKSVTIGQNDLGLMKTLAAAGNDHGKFLRMITVTVDLTAPLYWWKEFDTYKVGTVADSCSTMHKIQAKEFTLEDFSCEHLFDGCIQREGRMNEEYENPTTCLEYVISVLNFYREKFNQTKEKCYWWQMIQLLPSSYNQKRTVQVNYAVLKNMYHSRRNHKLDEWHTLCAWIESLPYSELITGGITNGEA